MVTSSPESRQLSSKRSKLRITRVDLPVLGGDEVLDEFNHCGMCCKKEVVVV